MASPQREPLSRVDTAWLQAEDPTNLMVIAAAWLFDQPLDFDRLKATVAQRLLTFSRFRQRVAVSPWAPGRPCWEIDPLFNLDAHLHRLALPGLGDEVALRALISDLLSTPLDFSKPLWQAHLIENFGNGCALFVRIHHCLADGPALVHVLRALTDSSLDAPWSPPATGPEPSRQVNPLLGLVGPLARTAAGMIQGTQQVLKAGAEMLICPSRGLDIVKSTASRAATLGKLLLRPPDTPTILKGQLGVAKRVAWSAPVPIKDFKAVGRVLGATVHEVLLSVVAGALRRYLQQRNETVAVSNLHAVIPTSVGQPESAPQLGNHFGLTFLSLPIAQSDPRERLAELKQRLRALRESPEAEVAFGIANVLGMVPRALQSPVVNLLGTKATAVMSSVSGPTTVVYFAGKPINRMVFWVPQAGRLGLGLSILSYARTLTLGVAADAGLVPDPETMVAGFHEELAQLLDTARLVKVADETTANHAGCPDSSNGEADPRPSHDEQIGNAAPSAGEGHDH